MFAYWTADPNISFKDTIVRTQVQILILYLIFSKSFHIIFGYNVYTSRYFVLFLV